MISQSELRRDVSAILRAADAGTEFIVTVRGRSVAKLGPLDLPQARRAAADPRQEE